METKTYTQYGIFSIIILSLFALIGIVLLIIFGFKDTFISGVLLLVTLIMLICLLIFYKLTISIDNKIVSFKLGAGFISRTYSLLDIQSCQAVKNKPLYGIGIRIIPEGWLYNVSGLGAVELRFKSKSSVVRIGTDKPDEIAGYINKLLNNEHAATINTQNNRTSFMIPAIIIFVAFLLPVSLTLTSTRETTVLTAGTSLTVKGLYGLTINYQDIKTLDTISTFPSVKLRTNGISLANSLTGNFKLEGNEKAKLFIRYGIPPYIVIRTNNLNVYLNFADPVKSRQLFSTIKTSLGH
jgi:hypothetical protein